MLGNDRPHPGHHRGPLKGIVRGGAGDQFTDGEAPQRLSDWSVAPVSRSISPRARRIAAKSMCEPSTVLSISKTSAIRRGEITNAL
jgi:hypothetical protein